MSEMTNVGSLFTKETGEKMQSNDYVNMRKRLNEYRKMIPMTKVEVADFLQISKQRYGEYEDGTKRMPCSVICKLHESGWDVNYIIAGIEDTGKCFLREKLMSYGKFDDKELILLFAWIFSNGIQLDDSLEQEHREIELLNIITKDYENHCKVRKTMVQTVREIMHVSQEELAERLHVCVKTYRKMEKDISQSYAQLLGDFCALSGFRPSLFINASVEWDIIEHLWKCLEEDEKKNVLQFVRNGIRLVNT